MSSSTEALVASHEAMAKNKSGLLIPPSDETDRSMARSSSKPMETLVAPPTLSARLTCVSILVTIFAVWGRFAFIREEDVPGFGAESPRVHSYQVPLALTAMYLVSLPLLRMFSSRYLSEVVDVKTLFRESMIVYNAAQVLLNGWMVYRIVDALWFRGHPFIGGAIDLVDTGASYAVWIHYCDKYLEFIDTYFMVLRGKMDQVSFLHVYHHTSIAWAWWIGVKLYPGGDIYFGALLNSIIHVMMYSYYTCSLLKLSCPWKRYLTQAQLLQFTAVMVYSAFSMACMPENGTWKQYFAHSVQDFEMLSLFLLFMNFYIKAYRKKRRESASVKAILESTSADSDAGSDTAVTEQESISSESSVEDVRDNDSEPSM